LWLNCTYLVRLRWGVLSGQALLAAGAQRLLGIRLPETALLTVVGMGLASNALAEVWLRSGEEPVREAHLTGLMLLDTVLLTAVLYLSGGPFNPFSTLYLVYVALAAVLLPARAAWGVGGASLVLFASLFPLQQRTPPAGLHLPGHDEVMRLHLAGMWLAFALSAFLIVWVILRVQRALASREAELVTTRELATRRARLASLATLAGGAAHELASPLSTIAVVLEALREELVPLGTPEEVLEDVRLAEAQVKRCRTLLQQMTTEAGELSGEAPTQVPLARCVALALDGVTESARIQIDAAPGLEDFHVEAPPHALAAALGGLFKNALQASPPDVPVLLRVRAESAPARVQLEVVDTGAGLTEEVLSRAGEPFFTTRAPGEGMGLGLFLARSLVERLGGTLSLSSRPGHGTTARMVLPRVELDPLRREATP